MVRPRGWHLPEKHVWLDGEPVPGSLFDFGAVLLPQRPASCWSGAAGPISICPSWKATWRPGCGTRCSHGPGRIGRSAGQHRATVLIETIPAAFEMDEILYELREHSAGLNCGRWDTFSASSRSSTSIPSSPCRTGAGDHDRALHAVLFAAGDQDLPSPGDPRHRRHGGADSRSRRDPAANEEALEKVRADKVREAGDGHDGTWVAHPGLVAMATRGLRRPACPRPTRSAAAATTCR